MSKDFEKSLITRYKELYREKSNLILGSAVCDRLRELDEIRNILKTDFNYTDGDIKELVIRDNEI